MPLYHPYTLELLLNFKKRLLREKESLKDSQKEIIIPSLELLSLVVDGYKGSVKQLELYLIEIFYSFVIDVDCFTISKLRKEVRSYFTRINNVFILNNEEFDTLDISIQKLIVEIRNNFKNINETKNDLNINETKNDLNINELNKTRAIKKKPLVNIETANNTPKFTTKAIKKKELVNIGTTNNTLKFPKRISKPIKYEKFIPLEFPEHFIVYDRARVLKLGNTLTNGNIKFFTNRKRDDITNYKRLQFIFRHDSVKLPIHQISKAKLRTYSICKIPEVLDYDYNSSEGWENFTISEEDESEEDESEEDESKEDNDYDFTDDSKEKDEDSIIINRNGPSFTYTPIKVIYYEDEYLD